MKSYKFGWVIGVVVLAGTSFIAPSSASATDWAAKCGKGFERVAVSNGPHLSVRLFRKNNRYCAFTVRTNEARGVEGTTFISLFGQGRGDTNRGDFAFYAGPTHIKVPESNTGCVFAAGGIIFRGRPEARDAKYCWNVIDT